ncbi:acyl-CoA dehydrogenase family protein [Vitiosangium sp. GDMCC 1.1324]|uniref:acyl-CoA dehydrogenase family protein n=1 Tax=Vitiosangium sp. (strain GDMCC 1.1324) TaxID=2138576 RepID=UPI000D36C35B|nr:acyl-CoA dehydrogenase family protein [Vitiosangium sp. GDMCC 1.1324]PTL83855.1 hydroxylase [Vitiosangium sp. GDMCC 1.1324]
MKKTVEATQVLQAARDLLPVISARAADIESGRRLPLDLLQQFKQAGFFRMFVPRSHGGLELDLWTACELLETLARADGAAGWTAMIGMETPNLLSLLSRERFDAIYSAGPDVIMGGPFNAQGQAVMEAEGYRVTGRWGFASGCEHCDWMFANCVVLQDGQPRPGPVPGMPLTRAMLFRASQVRIIDTWNVLGLRGTGSHDVAIDGAFCPGEDSFDIFFGASCLQGPGFTAPVQHFALHMAAVALGIAQGAVDDLVKLVTTGKRRMYARVPLIESPVLQLELGRIEMTVRAARALLRDTVEEFWTACMNGPASALPLAPRLSATLAWVTETAAGIVETCYRAGGSSSLKDGSSLQRRFRDIYTFRQHAAAAEGWFGQAGAALLGQPTGFWT